LALNPEIILFDEPMSALDAATRLLLRDEIKQIQKKFNSTMIYITHDQEEAFALSDRIMVMDNGTIQQIDTPEQLIINPVNLYIKEFVIDNLNRKIDSLVKFVKPGDPDNKLVTSIWSKIQTLVKNVKTEKPVKPEKTVKPEKPINPAKENKSEKESE